MNTENQVQKPERESTGSALTNILFNVVIPSIILTKASDPQYLGRVWALIVALSFPLTYGTIDLIRKKKWNFFSILGLVSVLLTGGLALLKLDGFWFAVKEAAIPAFIGLAVIILHNTKYCVFKMLMYNPNIFNVDLITNRLELRNTKEAFDKILANSNLLFAASFLLSTVLNFGLAIYLLKSPAGTVEFNEELGKMTALSFPVIMLPCMVILVATSFYLMKGITSLTGLEFEDMLAEHLNKDKKK